MQAIVENIKTQLQILITKMISMETDYSKAVTNTAVKCSLQFRKINIQQHCHILQNFIIKIFLTPGNC